MSVKDNVSSWINAYKAPDLTKMEYDQVIADLKKNKDELTTATSEIKGALSAASAAIDGYKNVASTLMSKVAAKTPMKKK
jgi:prefoldin subunit 5